ncbi:hypothetical protein S40285_01798 [Stachybotrys chlorohalonatus IBT 40285]|uniref:Hydrophobin n=2 Tax=Stachybotrys TaxID=74721 RepID=A0A084QHB9_STAC4|nr:hypothetical protein S7711_01805 [Stachybotrys chartarum IBT 7711]KFA47465.1 hypothetical protein S40293_02126 [Stachybotrys chartarum IBT 40293]KFA63354.1 hypothetical protein S40285_01798 [Stachybotrys chlorohalonata IBT 40285]KFA71824.1 hypothetical protein S40288_07933 [Stachybotrys chartarum IBT 40288]
MKTFTTVALIMTAIAGVSALPTAPEVRTTYDPCDGITQQPQCCATDVLGLVNLNCGNPPEELRDARHFSQVCASIGQRARCCLVPLLGQGIVCTTPVGVFP